MCSLLVVLLTAALLAPAPAAAQAAVGGSAAAGVANVPRPGDVLRLRIWREPELSGEFVIDETGTVVLPRLGRLNVAGLSAEALEETVVRGYEKYLQHLSIEVTLLRRVQIMGAVRDPGLYPVDATMTVSDALALAGGATPTGDPDRIELRRDGRRLEGRLSTNTRIAGSSIQSGDQLWVPERSWLSRNTSVVAAGLSASVSLLIALLVR